MHVACLAQLDSLSCTPGQMPTCVSINIKLFVCAFMLQRIAVQIFVHELGDMLVDVLADLFVDMCVDMFVHMLLHVFAKLLLDLHVKLVSC